MSHDLRGPSQLLVHPARALVSSRVSGVQPRVGKTLGQTVARYLYDPCDRVPTVGGSTLLGGATNAGLRDQREAEAREDVLCCKSWPLKSSVEATGPVELVLYVSPLGTPTHRQVGGRAPRWARREPDREQLPDPLPRVVHGTR